MGIRIVEQRERRANGLVKGSDREADTEQRKDRYKDIGNDS
jgi:hypothetical protein